MTIPAFVNSRASSADKAIEALAAHPVFDVRQVEPATMDDAIRTAVRGGASRVVVAGGDGTVACAASIVAGTPTELALLPGGTLNHFAKDFGVPTDMAEAARAAAEGVVRTADVAYVNDRLFLNTSSVGSYVAFVRARDLFEPRVGYLVASALASVRILLGMRSFRITLDVEGEARDYRTPIVFVGVGERELRMPTLGNRVDDGRRGLHVLVVRGRARARIFAIALSAVARGVKEAARTPVLDSFVVDRCVIELRRPRGNVAVDGEIVPMVAPLEYRFAPDALRVVTAERTKKPIGDRRAKLPAAHPARKFTG